MIADEKKQEINAGEYDEEFRKCEEEKKAWRVEFN